MRRTALIFGLLGLALTSAVRAQEAGDSLDLWLDFACFRLETAAGGDSLTAVELYYGINQKELPIDPVDGIRQLLFTLQVQNLADSSILQDQWKVNYKAGQSDSASASQLLSDIYRTHLMPGEYQVTLSCQDLPGGKGGEQKIYLDIPAFSGNRLELSDIQLALQITEAEGENRFAKNHRMVVPNPTTVYGSLNPLLYFYAEVYNLKPGELDSFYTLGYQILDSSGTLFKDYGSSERVKPGNSAVIATGLNVASLPMGKYHLLLTVEDSLSGEKDQSRKTFFIYREDEYLSEAGIQSGGKPEPQTEAEAQFLRNIFKYIAAPDDLRLYDGLTLEGKRTFVKDFWKSRDPNLATPANEYKREIYERFGFASQQFATGLLGGTQKGWKSDRGRVYIVYGPPDDVLTHPYSTDRSAWDKWIYHNVQGGVIFVFEDKDGYGNFELVHSTAKGEGRSPEWERFLTQEQSNPGN